MMALTPNYYIIKLAKRKGTRKNCNTIFIHIARAISNKKPLYLILKDKTIVLNKIYSVEKELGKDYDQIEIISWVKKIYLTFWHSQPDKPLDVSVYEIGEGCGEW